jgi:hypothetical protein
MASFEMADKWRSDLPWLCLLLVAGSGVSSVAVANVHASLFGRVNILRGRTLK